MAMKTIVKTIKTIVKTIKTIVMTMKTTMCIKIIRIQIWRVITQNIFDKFGWFLHHC